MCVVKVFFTDSGIGVLEVYVVENSMYADVVVSEASSEYEFGAKKVHRCENSLYASLTVCVDNSPFASSVVVPSINNSGTSSDDEWWESVRPFVYSPRPPLSAFWRIWYYPMCFIAALLFLPAALGVLLSWAVLSVGDYSGGKWLIVLFTVSSWIHIIICYLISESEARKRLGNIT